MPSYDIDATKSSYLNQFYQTLLSMLNSTGVSGSSGFYGTGDIPAPRLTLIGLTRVKIDEAMNQAEGLQFNLENADNSNIIDLYINALLDEAAKHVLQTAPIHILTPTDASTLTATELSTGSDAGFIYLPDDYLRFLSFKIEGWLQEINEVKPSWDKSYSHQKYMGLRGGIAKPKGFINAKVKVNTPVKQVDSVTLKGVSGSAILSGPGGLDKSIDFATSLADTATAFFTAYAADYLTAGIVLTNPSDKVLTCTAVTAGVPFVHPRIITTAGDLSGDVTLDTPNTLAREGKKILEYYSDPSLAHSVEKFMYIANVGAEYIQSDLYDALTWVAASKLLQIWGEFSGNQSYADRAMKQVELSYQNLL